MCVVNVSEYEAPLKLLAVNPKLVAGEAFCPQLQFTKSGPRQCSEGKCTDLGERYDGCGCGTSRDHALTGLHVYPRANV